MTTIRIPAPLRGATGGLDEVSVEAADVGGALEALTRAHPELRPRLLDEQGSLRPFVNVFLGGQDVRNLDGQTTAVGPRDVLTLLPAVAGGAAKDQRLSELRESIGEVDVDGASAQLAEGAALVDVREPDEVAQGSPPGALRMGRGFLELRIEDALPDKEAPVLVMCAGGVRSLFAAESLARLGYGNVRSVAGGFNAWKEAGYPVEVPRVLTGAERERYGRHLLVPEVGEAGQVRLLESKVLLVGAGGLGSPAALYLAAAGVGTLGVVDDDVVDRSNLQRQILHTDAAVGTPKVESAQRTLHALNPDITVVPHPVRLTSDNVEEIFSQYDVIVDGTDNFPTRYLVNDACVKLEKPNVHGSIFRFDGQVSVFWPANPKGRGPCYRCLYPAPPPPELAPSCAEAGVLGVLPGVIGTLEAVETVKLLLDRGDLLVSRVLVYDALRQRFDELSVSPNPECAWCAPDREFPGYVDYAAVCADPVATS